MDEKRLTLRFSDLTLARYVVQELAVLPIGGCRDRNRAHGRISVQNQYIQQVQVARSETMIAAVLGLMVGTFLIIGVGFAHPEAIHNAAHDTRHTTAFPCH